MEKHEIVETSCILFLFCERHFFCSRYFFKLFVPFLFKFFFVHKSIIFDTHIQCKCRTVSSDSNFLINFSKWPFEFSFIKIGNICWYNFNKKVAEFTKFLLILLTIEFKWIIHDVAIVESSNSDRFFFFIWFLIGKRCQVCFHYRYIFVVIIILYQRY